ncbi:MAG: DUF305 domain-containing protein [Williamsia sp.]|nr:DUF305 domain-containing protein [Williamsia sp.]
MNQKHAHHDSIVHDPQNKNKSHYTKLAMMVILSFISMYVLMYSMIDQLANFVPNINQFYMAGLMTMPMVIIELLLMRSMYMNKKLNAGIMAASLVLLLGFFLAIREQAAVSDRQFLRGMIPHHAAAILMSKKAPSQDPEIGQLQHDIITSQ